MGIEIERRFLVEKSLWNSVGLAYTCITQGYLSLSPERIVRIRVCSKTGAFLTIKGKPLGGQALEFEYEIPVADATCLLENMRVGELIKKNRYYTQYQGTDWVVDEFLEENRGLLLAEVELQFAGQTFSYPPYLGREITLDHNYANSSLSQRPFTFWEKKKEE